MGSRACSRQFNPWFDGVHDGRAERLAAARLYLCTDGRRRRGDLAEFLDAVLAGGVDIVQLRDKGLEARQELALLEVFADACRGTARCSR